MLLAVALIAAAGFGGWGEFSKDGFLVAAEQKSGCLVAMDGRQAGANPFVWRWDPKADSGIAPEDRPAFGATAECKCARCGDEPTVIMVGSVGGFAEVSLRTGRALCYGLADRTPHSIAKLPGDRRYVVACAVSNVLCVVDGSGAPFSPSRQRVRRYAFSDAHGVEWDASRGCLWALGRRGVVGFDWDPETLELRERVCCDFPDPSLRDGHDLTPDGCGGYFVTVPDRILRFFPDERRFEDVRKEKDVKSLSPSAFGLAVTKVREVWWTDRILVRNGEEERVVGPYPGLRFYKARWMRETVGALPKSGIVLAADQASRSVVAFAAGAAGTAPARTWAWKAADDSRVPMALRGACLSPNDCRMVADERGDAAVLALFSEGGFARIDAVTCRAAFVGRTTLANPQQIAPLPAFGKVAIACGRENAIVVCDASGKTDGGETRELQRLDLKGANGITWDARRNCLWAAGAGTLVAYGWDGRALVERRRHDCRSTSGGAKVNDLSLEADGSLDIVTESRIIRFDPELEGFELVREQVKTPSYSLCGRFGEAHTVVREGWWTDRVVVRRGYAAHEVVLPGAKLFRARWTDPFPERRVPIVCRTRLHDHLQGVATDGTNIFWASGNELVKTDATGRPQAERKVGYHHGSPCVVDGVVYVAVNEGKFNQLDAAKNFVRAYRASDLAPVGSWPIPEPRGGAGGVTAANGRFYVVGGLHPSETANRVAEYDADFNLVKVHELAGYTRLGFQTACFAKGRFWFGAYADWAPGGQPDATHVWTADFGKCRRVETHTAEGVLEFGGRMYAGRQFNTAEGFGGLLRPIVFPPSPVRD